MRFISHLMILMVTILLAACGGGGGSGGVGSGEVTAATTGGNFETRLTVQLKDLNGVSIQTLPASGNAELFATLTTTAGVPLAGQIVKISESLTSLVFFPNGNTATTDRNGVAKMKVSRATSTKFGSGTFYAAFDGFYCLSSSTCDGYLSSSSNTLLSSFNNVSFRVDPPAFKLELLDSVNTVTNSIGASGLTSLKATLKFEDGTPVVQKRVEVTGDLTKVAFPEGNSQLTDASGVAIIKIARATLNANGAGTLNVASTISGLDSTGIVNDTVITGILDFSVGVANIALTDLNLGSTSLAAFGNRPISVKTTINGVPATNTSVAITFNASCGSTSPATVTIDATGTASTTYTASLATCAGTNVSISASAAGATPVSGIIAIASSIATNVQFVSATPQLIYLKDSVGTTQAQVVFKVVDSNGNPLQNKKLRLSLSNTSTGVTLDTVGNTAPVDLTTDNLGLVSAAVFSGTIPTSLNVKATLLDSNNTTTNVFSNSNLLTVASGRPTQRSLSLALGKLSIEGFDIDGETTTVTLAMADRQGNPVPPGTQVNFVAESGVLLPAVCFVPPVTPATESSPAIPTSSCTVNFKSAGTRTANGRVSILAYVVGEEDFVDINGNNVYDFGIDTFTGLDLGRAFRDDNSQSISGANGSYDAGEFQVPRLGTSACAAGTGCPGDGVWGTADVRQQATLVLATSFANITGVFENLEELLPAGPIIPPATTPSYPASVVMPGIDLIIRDLNGNSVPTGSKIEVDVTDNTATAPILIRGSVDVGTCSVIGTKSFVVPNSLGSYAASIVLKECTTKDLITVKVTTPRGSVTPKNFTIP